MDGKDITMHQIAEIRNDFPDKFGIPRQSGLAPGLKAVITFINEYRNPDIVRGLEHASHIWLLWGFSLAKKDNWNATVRPPRLGGNTRMGVLATRSPFRPNPIGLSAVKLDKIEYHKNKGPILYISGADLVDRTPIYDIKPYITYADCISSARNDIFGAPDKTISVNISPEELIKIEEGKRQALVQILQQNPSPAYKNDPDRIYSFEFAGRNIKYFIDNNILTVISIN